MPLALHAGWAGQEEVRRLRTLYELVSTLSRVKSVEDIYEAALSGLLAATDADRAAILTFDEDGMLRFRAWRDLSAEYRAAVAGHSPWRAGAMDAEPVAVLDVSLNAALAPYHEVLEREGIRAAAFIPLMLEAGVFGRLTLYYARPHEFAADEIDVARVIAAHVALAVERKRAELLRERSEQRLQTILDNAATPVFLKDLDGRYLFINRRFEELFHVRREEFAGHTDFDLFPPERAEAFRQTDRSVVAAGAPLAIEESVPHDDGMHNYLSVKFPLEGPRGEVMGVCGIATDITEREQLQAASRHLAAIVESSDDAIISKDMRGIITSWNGAAERMFGYSAEEVIGRPIAILAPADRRGEMPEILARIRAGQRVEHYETQRMRKDGSVIDVSLTVSPVRDAAGQITGASKIARDITDRKQADRERVALLQHSLRIQSQLERSNEELKRANQDLEIFAYSASHDLQEPLRTIAISAQLLERRAGAQLDGDASRFLQQILHGAESMNSLSRDLLAYIQAAKSAEGPPPLADSGAILENVLENLRGPIEEAGAVVSRSDFLPAVHIHESRLGQVLQNLISNAVKYRRKGVTPRVSVSCEERDGWWVFSVADNGIGIESRYASQIFAAFKRLHSRDRYPGSGIGLAICQRVVEQYGGRIWLDKSEPGSGSTFCFTIRARSR